MCSPGVSLTEMAVSPLPGHPNAVWTVRKNAQEEFDAYIVVSFVNATLVLSIGDTVEEVNDSGFLGTTPSLRVGLLGDDAFMQVRLLAPCPSPFPAAGTRAINPNIQSSAYIR